MQPEPSRNSNTESTGFDTMLGKLVIDHGFITNEELQHCNNELAAARKEGDPGTLRDSLISNDFVTQRQLERIRKEFDATKSTQSIPGYKLIKKLGAGAMATVMLAEQRSLNRQVAIKILPKRYSEDPNYVERFIKEGKAAAQLNHPNIVHAYEVGQAGEHHFFVMEYVEGSDVREEIKEKKRLAEDTAIEVMLQSAKALEHAHSKGLIHRDIKPANIMLTRSGSVKVADLGLARSVDDTDLAKKEEGRAYGTANYMSPEQIRGKVDIGPPADIYGLGATCYNMVTGKTPFSGKTPSEVMRGHLKTPLRAPDELNPTLSSGFCQIIEMCMGKELSERYESMTDLIEDLELVKQGDSPHFAKPAVDLSTLTLQSDPGMPSAGSSSGTNGVVRRDQGNSLADNPLLLISLAGNAILILILILVVVTSS
ncbi:MAG: serine/threonine-protein kinase [Phycisphaerales bacterium]|nr:serine/threonine-protein kinase [Phycisphaerales bacterium]